MLRFEDKYDEVVKEMVGEIKLYDILIDFELMDYVEEKEIEKLGLESILIQQGLIMTDYGLLDKDLVTVYETFRKKGMREGLTNYERALYEAIIDVSDLIEENLYEALEEYEMEGEE